MRTSKWLVAVCLILSFSSINSQAQEITESGKKLGLKVETVLEGLTNPTAITIRPGTLNDKLELFISDSGAYRVIKMLASKPGKAIEVITGFKKNKLENGLDFNVGPLGLAFLNSKKLVVGGSGKEVEDQIVHVFSLPTDKTILVADKPDHVSKLTKSKNKDHEAIGNFYSLTMNKKRDRLFAVSSTADKKGWLLRNKVTRGKLTALIPMVSTQESVNTPMPVAIVTSPKSSLLVGQLGEVNKKQDSLLSFYSPNDSELKLNLRTSLFDIIALAYSPAKSSDESMLYALDIAWAVEGKGGLYRIEASDPTSTNNDTDCFSNLLIKLERPSAMVFAPNGTLYICTFGNDKNKPTGKLLKVTGFPKEVIQVAAKETSKPTKQSIRGNIPIQRLRQIQLAPRIRVVPARPIGGK